MSAWERDPDLQPCPVAGCHRHHGPHLLMCYVHWKKVPRDLQRLVYRLYNGGSKKPGYAEAAQRAIEAAAA